MAERMDASDENCSDDLLPEGNTQKFYGHMDDEECITMVSESISNILRLSLNDSFRSECFELLRVTNAVDAGESIKKGLADCINIELAESLHKTIEQLSSNFLDDDDDSFPMDIGQFKFNSQSYFGGQSSSQPTLPYFQLPSSQSSLRSSQTSSSNTSTNYQGLLKIRQTCAPTPGPSQWISLDLPSTSASAATTSRSQSQNIIREETRSQVQSPWISMDFCPIVATDGTGNELEESASKENESETEAPFALSAPMTPQENSKSKELPLSSQASTTMTRNLLSGTAISNFLSQSTTSTPPPVPHEEVELILKRAFENYKIYKAKRAKLDSQSETQKS